MNGAIPLHLFLPCKELIKGRLPEMVNCARSEGVSSFWLEAHKKADIALIKNFSSRNDVKVVSLWSDPSLLKSYIKWISPNNGGEKKERKVPEAFSFTLSCVDTLLGHREDILRQGYELYLFHDFSEAKKAPFNTSTSSAVEGMLAEITEAVEKLLAAGLKNLFLHAGHPDPVALFNINRYLKERFGAPHVISLICGPGKKNREQNALLNSLTLGSLFYEKLGNVVLVRLSEGAEYSDHDHAGRVDHTPEGVEYSPENVRDAVVLAKKILGSFRLYPTGYTIISCPTCGRCQVDLMKMTGEIESQMKRLERSYRSAGQRLEDMGGIVVAVMGCNVNGPGEASNADIGIACGKNGMGIIFKNGKPTKTLPEKRLVDEFMRSVKLTIDSRLAACSS